jgi:hypothetical protein
LIWQFLIFISKFKYLADKYKFLNETGIKFGVININYNEINEVIEIKPSIGIDLNWKKDKLFFIMELLILIQLNFWFMIV